MNCTRGRGMLIFLPLSHSSELGKTKKLTNLRSGIARIGNVPLRGYIGPGLSSYSPDKCRVFLLAPLLLLSLRRRSVSISAAILSASFLLSSLILEGSSFVVYISMSKLFDTLLTAILKSPYQTQAVFSPRSHRKTISMLSDPQGRATHYSRKRHGQCSCRQPQRQENPANQGDAGVVEDRHRTKGEINSETESATTLGKVPPLT